MRWLVAIPLTNISTVECASALFRDWIAWFGVPAVITSDWGMQFTSSLWDFMCFLLNITNNMTTTFHPLSNGIVEHLHRFKF